MAGKNTCTYFICRTTCVNVQTCGKTDCRRPGGCRGCKNICEVESGNEVVSCFPTADVVIPQHQWATFVWNTNNPDFVQSELVDIYLFHGDSLQEVSSMTRGGATEARIGRARIYPTILLVDRAERRVVDGRHAAATTTFSAVQTTFADSVLSSLASATATKTLRSSASSASHVTRNDDGSHRTAASKPLHRRRRALSDLGIVIIVLGIIARDAREDRTGRRPIPSPPSMAQHDAPAAPVAPVAAAGLAHAGSITSHGHVQTPSRAISPAERTTSPDSTGSRAEARPFSHSDAAVMAAAFRTAMRQPGRPLAEDERSESPATERDVLLERELADAGTDIRRVGSVRGVRVESSSEGHELAARNSF
ncbi:hypothetical protein B0H17DRAFT_1214914 [Mycena rosella]|uniref:Uncharacterized protein n=1 Tax=Mycena rosella TaxID=1033263 RepID=A0AAD7CML0_MYCRO|nr:hypothetical protein B0H17DRAFT_1214914 [Mycena rosella]